MTVNQMLYFVTLCREGGFSRAAEALYITQPAMSRQIQILEEELNVKLIRRNRGKAFEITPAGKKYYEMFDRFLSEKSDLEFLLQNFELENKTVYRIGLMSGWHLADFIGACNAEVRTRFLEAELQFEFYTPTELIQLVRERKLDALVVIENFYEFDTNYETRYIREIHSAFFVSAKHPAVQGGRIDRSRIRGPFITLKRMGERRSSRFQLEEIINNQKIIMKECNSVESVSQNILSGEGVSVCDEWSEPFFSSAFAAEIMPEYSMNIILAFQEKDPVFRQIVDFMEEKLKA